MTHNGKKYESWPRFPALVRYKVAGVKKRSNVREIYKELGDVRLLICSACTVGHMSSHNLV